MTEPSVRSVVAFVRSIALLAMPAEAQILWLNSFPMQGEAGVVNELALEFDDGFRLLSFYVSSMWLPESVMPVLQDIDSLLDEIGALDESAWHVGSLKGSEHWQRLRQLATQALILI